jgi:hypothetical protein
MLVAASTPSSTFSGLNTGVLVVRVSMLLRAAFVRYRDVRPIWDALANAMLLRAGERSRR